MSKQRDAAAVDQLDDNETPESDPEKVTAETPTAEEPKVESGTAVVEEEPELVESLSRADVEKFSEKFGAEKGMKYLLGGTSFEEALSTEFDLLKTKSDVVGSDGRGEDNPVGTFSDGENNGKGFSNGILPPAVERFASVIRLQGAASRN